MPQTILNVLFFHSWGVGGGGGGGGGLLNWMVYPVEVYLKWKSEWKLGTSRFTSVSQYIDTQLPQYVSQG